MAVPPGGLLGRLSAAALHLADPAISEAHAMVSLRERALYLLSLRGRVEVDGAIVSEILLQKDQLIRLAPDVALKVQEVCEDRELLALDWGAGPVALPAPLASLRTRPSPGLVVGYDPAAAAHLWWDTPDWQIRAGAAPPEPLCPGDQRLIDGLTFRAVALPASGERTESRGMNLYVSYDQTRIQTGTNQPEVVLIGNAARLIAALVSSGKPMPWRTLAAEIWWEDGLKLLRQRRAAEARDDAGALRQNNDEWLLIQDRLQKARRDLRRQLADAGLRTDLLQSEEGVYRLSLGSLDRVHDQIEEP